MMPTMKKEQLSQLEREATTLAGLEVLVETNSGTYGAAECCTATRCGDPSVGDYRIYESVGSGQRRRVGCAPGRAPGRARQINTEELTAKRKILAHLYDRIRHVTGGAA